jgi:hypothetical protein
MKRILLVLLAVVAIPAVAFVVDVVSYSRSPTYLIESCLDHGGRWNYHLGKCECTPEELSSPTVTKELIAHCDKPSPAPER